MLQEAACGNDNRDSMLANDEKRLDVTKKG